MKYDENMSQCVDAKWGGEGLALVSLYGKLKKIKEN
jgi:hypothetical protein